MQVASLTVQPVQLVRRYDLFFDVDFTGLSFTGKATVDLDTTGDIRLDAVGLQVKSVKHGNRNLQYKQTSNAVEIKTGKFSGPLDIEFNGKVSENFTGFYKASYGDGYILRTHLEAVQARKLFPCLDHPAFKAVFKLVVRTAPDLKVISNMPVESEEVRANKKVVSFKQTPKMSTYLFYLGVGKFVEEHSRHGQTHLYAAHARLTGSIKTEFSFEAAQKVLDYYESYFGIPYQLPKLHQVAVPEFAYRAMENWGAITYREILMHVDEISYGKGASILRMLEAYTGPDKFQNGVAKYLEKFRYSNAAGQDLWNHLQEASGTDVNRIMEAWISKPGFPIITATLSNKKLLLEQERFLQAGGIEKQTWPVPVTMMVDGKPQSLLFDKESAQVNIGSSPKSLKLNIDQTGFYHVHYQGRELQDLLWKSRLSPLEKWGLISDPKALLLAGLMPIREYLSLLERFRKDEGYLPMFDISDQLELLHVLAPEKMRNTSRRFHTDQLKTLQAKTDENSMMLKGIVAGRLTIIDDAYAKEQGSKIKDLASVDPDMKRQVVMG